MIQRIVDAVKSLFDIDKEERLKVLFLSISFFLVIGSYTLAHDLKDALFVHIVGKSYVPIARILTLFFLIPGIFIFSKLVDSMKKHQLVYCYMLAYGIGGLIITYFIGHPTIGLPNTDASKYRIFGWLIYFFCEGYPPFISSLFWAFTNSITSPKAAASNYSIIIACSKIGGILVSGFAIWLLTRDASHHLMFNDVTNHQILFGLAAFLLLLVPIFIYFTMTKVSARNLHGYEATYQVDQEEEKETKEEKQPKALGGIFSGLTLLTRYPYILGIFGMIFFWEVVNAIVAFERLGVGQAVTSNISDYTRFMFSAIIEFHLIGLFIIIFGTKFIIKRFGEKTSLMLVPIITGLLLLYYFWSRTAGAIIQVFVILRALNYAFANPLRETLYIPTSKDMRFKSKSWIDTFGAKLAKSTGSTYNIIIQIIPLTLVNAVNGIFFTILISLWTAAAYFLGKRYEKAVENNEVIGVTKS